jgi:hypothetical protein
LAQRVACLLGRMKIRANRASFGMVVGRISP